MLFSKYRTPKQVITTDEFKKKHILYKCQDLYMDITKKNLNHQ